MVSKKAEIHSVADRFHKPEEYYHIDRRELIELMPEDARCILDVGCGAGESWTEFAGDVHGLEYDPVSADAARERLASVTVGDVQKMDLPYEDQFFDAIVFADVLEHLYDPWGTLLRLRRFLKPTGCILISLPNIRYYKVIRGLLLDADFAYTRSGVLDIDHVRFFARRNVEWMLEQTGFRVDRWDRIRRGSSKYRFMNRILFGRLDDFLTRQYLVRARLTPDFQEPQSPGQAALDSKGANTNPG